MALFLVYKLANWRKLFEMRDLRKCKNETMYAKGVYKYAYDVMSPLQPVWMVPTPKLYTSYSSSSLNATGPTVLPLTVDIHSNGSYDGIDAKNVTHNEVHSSLAAEIEQAVHHQFTIDEAMDQIDQLAGEIRRLQCENRKSTRNSILLSAKSNGGTRLRNFTCHHVH